MAASFIYQFDAPSKLKNSNASHPSIISSTIMVLLSISWIVGMTATLVLTAKVPIAVQGSVVYWKKIKSLVEHSSSTLSPIDALTSYDPFSEVFDYIPPFGEMIKDTRARFCEYGFSMLSLWRILPDEFRRLTIQVELELVSEDVPGRFKSVAGDDQNLDSLTLLDDSLSVFDEGFFV
eukprot:GHVH01003030.1.p1 GENE.GHVH01003030.1~~GHVH01003030.1.p1  ORF type:complete len:178 (-),score=35.69 GHVH01003030.1:91-624(-)